MRLFLVPLAERGPPVAHMLPMLGWLLRRRVPLTSGPAFSMAFLEKGESESLELAKSPACRHAQCAAEAPLGISDMCLW